MAVVRGHANQFNKNLTSLPSKVLQMTTLNPADFLGRAVNMGSIDVGKNADIVLLNGNPVESVQNLHKISGVGRAGFYYSPADLDALRAQAK
jgi:imidazolonepropionase-like amidohydrolase